MEDAIDYGAAGDAFLATLNRAVAAAVDITVMKETGVQAGPTFSQNDQTPTRSLAPGVDRPGALYSGAGSWLSANWPLVALGLAAGLVLYKLANKG